MIVIEFGGTSVQDAEALRRLHAIVAARREEKPLVAVSALAGVSEPPSAIVAAALEVRGLPARRVDVKDLLGPGREVLPHLLDGSQVLVTQCGIAGDAAVLGAALGAERIEIWTDVDGIMTGPPHLVPGARRLHVLSFDEAAELAACGATVPHASSLRPAQEAGIPVWLANARRPESPGTLLLADTAAYQDERAVVRSIAVQNGITVVTVHSTHLERILAVFAGHATPVDLVSTAAASVSLTVADARALDPIAAELRAIAPVEVTPEMAMVCIVGAGIRRARGITARIFRTLGGTELCMISQGAHAISVRLVVHARDADDVVCRLHEEFFQGNLPRAIFGEAHADLETAAPSARPTPHQLAGVAATLAAAHGTPFYLYELDRIETQVRKLRAAFAHPRLRLAYACKANFHPAIFTLMRDLGVGIDAVSPMEVDRALTCGIPARDVLFTANNASIEATLAVHDRGVPTNLGALSDVRRFAAHRRDTEIFLRFNPGIGKGHHAHVVTGGLDSKFGILAQDLETARDILAGSAIRVVGLHAHIGSGNLDLAPLLDAARRLAAAAALFPALRSLNVGGGLGVPYRRDDPEFDIESYGAGLRAILSASEARLGRALELWVEPGRFLVAQSGTLVVRVTCRKETAGHIYIGVDSGMNHLVRPALYGAYHPVRNLSAPEAALEFVDVVGNICESADVFALNRPLPSPQEGHLLAIETVGAYGFAMASHYNLWPLPREFVLRHGEVI